MATSEIAADLKELRFFRAQIKRPNVQKLVDTEIARLDKIVNAGKATSATTAAQAAPTSAAQTTAKSLSRPVKKLTTFAYDESDKFIKLYYTMPKVQSLAADAIKSTFTENSFYVNVANLEGVDYVMEANGLTAEIDVQKSTIKQKTDSLLVMLKKIAEGQKWDKLLKLEKSTTADVPPPMDTSGDPQAGLMSMMKKMYDEGDDNMKRQINKAWFESSQKKRDGADLGVEDLGM